MIVSRRVVRCFSYAVATYVCNKVYHGGCCAWCRKCSLFRSTRFHTWLCQVMGGRDIRFTIDFTTELVYFVHGLRLLITGLLSGDFLIVGSFPFHTIYSSSRKFVSNSGAHGAPSCTREMQAAAVDGGPFGSPFGRNTNTIKQH